MMRTTRPTRLMPILVVFVAMLDGTVPARGCPNCKEAVSLQSEDTANLSNGYNWSVLFMLAIPFSMFGTGAFFVHRAVKRGSLPEL